MRRCSERRETPVLVKRSISAALVSRNTVAVLPFADHSVGGDLQYFCRGVREEIVHHLTRLSSLRLLASDETRTPAEKTEPRADHQRQRASIGRPSPSDGAARRRCERLLSVVRVDRLGDRRCVCGTGKCRGGDLQKTRTRARRQAARIRPFAAPSENLAAHNLYLQGCYHLNQRTEEGLRKALEFFEKALVEDAEYALAHAGLADAYGLLAHYGVFGPAEVWSKAASSAATAVMLDADSAEAHTSLAHVKSTQDWDWANAEREFQRAISLNPRYATAHHWYAMSCLAPLGRLDEALNEIMIAQSIDPVSSIVARDLAVVHFYRRDFEMALEQCDHTIELNPHFAPAYWMLGVIQEQRKDFDESAAAFQRAVHLSPQTPRMHGGLGRTFALSGRRKQALEVLQKLEAYAKERYVSPLEFAWIQFALGDIDLGFKWLAKASDDRAFDLISIKVVIRDSMC